MKAYNVFFLLAAAALLLCVAAGCKAPETLAKGISAKSIAISGAFSYGRAGLDKTTQTPELLSLCGWGDYVSVVSGTEIFRLEDSEDASIFNSEAKSKKRKVFFASADQKRMDEVLKAFTTNNNQGESK